jgi:hypothetical protein
VLDLHFLHHLLAVGFDGALGRAQRSADLLVLIAPHEKIKDLQLARRQSPDTGAHAV